MNESDYTWVVFFSKPVLKLRCFADAVPFISVAAQREHVQFRVDVTEVLSEEENRTLGYDTVSSNVEGYLEVLRKGKDFYPKNPLVGVDFPKEDDESNERMSSVVVDWDFTSTKPNKSAATDQASAK